MLISHFILLLIMLAEAVYTDLLHTFRVQSPCHLSNLNEIVSLYWLEDLNAVESRRVTERDTDNIFSALSQVFSPIIIAS